MKLRLTKSSWRFLFQFISGLNFAEEVGISAGYRYSDYTTKGNGTSNSFELTLGLRVLVGQSMTRLVRVNQSTALRAPNVFDLYVGINTGLVDL